jgi:hypothetical protein
MLNNVLDHSEELKIPGQKPNIPGHMVADAAVAFPLLRPNEMLNILT